MLMYQPQEHGLKFGMENNMGINQLNSSGVSICDTKIHFMVKNHKMKR
jgi:hypothetical protein